MKRELDFVDYQRGKYPLDFILFINGVPNDLCMKSVQASQPFFLRKTTGEVMGGTRNQGNRYDEIMTISRLFCSEKT